MPGPTTYPRSLLWHQCRLEAICELIDGSTVLSRPATIRACGTHGMVLVLAERWESGNVLAVSMKTTTDRVAFAKLAYIVQVQPDRLGDWLLKVSFLQPLTAEEVEWLLCS